MSEQAVWTPALMVALIGLILTVLGFADKKRKVRETELSERVTQLIEWNGLLERRVTDCEDDRKKLHADYRESKDENYALMQRVYELERKHK